MLRTALACIALLWTAWAGAGWLTHDWQVWTAEGARRLEVARTPVAAPPVSVEGPGLALRPLADVLGKGRDVTIVEFIYTRCESVCLALGSTFQQMQQSLREDGRDAHVRLLSISFDPLRDGHAELAAYARRLHADPALWRFVRVAGEAQTQQLLDAFQVVVVPDGRGDFEHNAALLLVDAQGRLMRIFDAAEQQLALDYARHIAAGGAP